MVSLIDGQHRMLLLELETAATGTAPTCNNAIIESDVLFEKQQQQQLQQSYCQFDYYCQSVFNKLAEGISSTIFFASSSPPSSYSPSTTTTTTNEFNTTTNFSIFASSFQSLISTFQSESASEELIGGLTGAILVGWIALIFAASLLPRLNLRVIR